MQSWKTWRGWVLVLIATAVGLTWPLLPAPAEEGSSPAQPEVAWIFPEWSAPQSWGQVEVPPVPATLGSLAEAGKQGFASLCASCHGAEGRGDGLFAPDLPRVPRDLAADPLRTRDRTGPVSPAEVYRTLTVGSIEFGMPSFAHLTPHDRWAMTAYVLSLRDEQAPTVETATLPARPTQVDPAYGEKMFGQFCAPCHGASGDGTGPVADALRDQNGEPCRPANFRHGPAGYRGGARAEDVARTISLGRPGTPMVAMALEAKDLWAVAEYVAGLAEQGELDRRQRWDAFYAQRRRKVQSVRGRVLGEEEGKPRWDAERSAQFAKAPSGTQGCTACHDGIARIASGAMAQALEAFSGGHPDRECAICHEGDPVAATKLAAHDGMIVNPGSLWVTSVGQGCGKCHSDRGVLTSLHGEPLPEARGGALLEVRSRQTDPSGASGGNHAYRMQRALMAQESGKAWLAAESAGLNKGSPRYTNFALDDPDGAVPSAGSEDYRALIARALEAGHLTRLEKSDAFPTFDEAEKLLGNKVLAAYADYYRKECSRCHLWGEGQAQRGEYRSAGCSACHVITGEFGYSQSQDPTIPPKRSGHIERHQLVMKTIPEEQCNHCHTRGAMTKHSDAHQRAGIGCVDCHSSIDVHGDGNIYPSIPHQLEVRCEDCHGTHSAAPWELPLGYGSPYEGEGQRGTYKGEEREHLLTARGNPRTNWFRDGDRVVIESFLDGRLHVAPQLGGEPPVTAPPQFPRDADSDSTTCTARRADLPGHERIACASCHGSRSLRCVPCHVSYFTAEFDRDWLLSGLDYDPKTTRQRVYQTPGGVGTRPGQNGVTWGQPDIGEHPSGRLVPHIPGCLVLFSYVDETGVKSMQPHHNPNMEGYPPPVRPTLSHELAIPARGCKECHKDGEQGGPVDLPGDR